MVAVDWLSMSGEIVELYARRLKRAGMGDISCMEILQLGIFCIIDGLKMGSNANYLHGDIL